jgi:formylglycine-generating enzyme required for sulfatase activity
MQKVIFEALILSLTTLVASAPAHSVSIDWLRVGFAGNAADSRTGYGSVDYAYRISKHEVTNAQYTEFLNAVAVLDPNGLYSEEMAMATGGITRTGDPGSYLYSAIAGREQMPVVYVSFYDALRFANWMHNGQLSGAQDTTTTEDGAYTITPQGIADNSITRNAGATIFLPNEDEWYKAAYHDALGTQATNYLGYPTGTDTQPTCSAPTSDANHANCGTAVGDVTSAGSYTGSTSPWGTFDQAGNVREWNEAVIDEFDRGFRGGAWFEGGIAAAVTSRRNDFPTFEFGTKGFRLASIPEPGTGLLLALGLLGLAPRRRTGQRAEGARGPDPQDARIPHAGRDPAPGSLRA